MAYTFEPFLDVLSRNWYDDDPLLQRLLSERGSDAAADPYPDTLGEWGARCAGRLAALAEESARPENRPRLRHFDAYRRRVDEIVLPASTLETLTEVEGRGRLGAPHGDPFQFYARVYLVHQNGEAGVACSMGCTDGFTRALEALGDDAVHATALARIRRSSAEHVWHAAQFVTEVQGGSDIGANVTRAVPDGGRYRLFGRKWFCSNINADYFLVTARPEGATAGSHGVGLFLVPAFAADIEDDRATGPDAPVRNGYTIDRLKDKLGTRELVTAEVTFDGAVAWPVGPADRGVANLLRYVLTPSRMGCVSFAAAALRQAERITRGYAAFRTAFGHPILEYGPVRETIEGLERAHRRTLAAYFELLRLWNRPVDATERLDFRILLSICKPALTRAAMQGVHDAVMLLGGNGIEERFSPLPRLLRDAVIMETWEGPHAVLNAQALNDLVRYEVDPAEFVARIAGAPRPDLVAPLARILASPDAPESAVALARLGPDIVRALAERVEPPHR